MMIKYPDYNNSILNISNSVLKSFGAEYTHNTLPELDEVLSKNYKNVVLMVFDAMGSFNIKEFLSDDSFLINHKRKDITSVFPATTTAALTTLKSGLMPCEHSWLGWSLHFDEVDNNVNIFVNTDDNYKPVADYNVAEKYISYKSVVDKINEAGTAKAFSVSPFDEYKINTFEELISAVKEICEQDERHYIYAYWPQPDSSMHKEGIHSNEAKEWIERINNEIENLGRQLNDTLIIVTADHGHINGDNKLISDYKDITDTLKWMPSMEARTRDFFVKDGMHEQFKKAFNKHFGKDFILFSKKEVLEKNLFGKGKSHPRFEGFIGDYIAASVTSKALCVNENEYRELKGVHAGLTEEEMTVPLIIIECNKK
ncbi:MAG: alkaline phosphatase family protein [Inconstantimicrobium porci]|uniref:alkaline phosphatase family protein n=1 Tax=Inconstantimicrobium porci TaxID=2652291 RepID=UPI002A90F808|nr:alkaline phosphatase family protein [Inconstantimicrobium porci]MDY5910555.1 alkaline phosphatase family protein [Inconstantimicrobium porci]